MDEVVKRNIANFAAGMGEGYLFEFMPFEGRVYFLRGPASVEGRTDL